ncbi:MAG TPA: DNA recombination protein RmuC [Burkholderiaceae bacterium]|nr:DNA recombination protein RmuC [Burkholderiaceae bacterium]
MPGVQEFLPTVTLVLLAVATVLLLILVLRRPPDLVEALQLLTREQIDGNRRLERALIEHVAARSREQREELSVSVDRFAAGQLKQLAQLTAANDQRLAEVRATLEQRLRELQSDNARRLEEMRRTVDEKLHATLEQRLGESFRQVSERLEQVHRGLGEMRVLASDVGDLKRVLTNVKTRGTWGEIQLAALLEQMLVPDQYQANVATVPGATQRVEFAIRLPGASADAPVWLPIDAKFPREDYERLMAAQERADAPAAEAAGRQLAARIRDEARAIRGKYLAPPATTDFAILFLPTEGLYAEITRRPGLLDELQRDHRVVLAGPTTLAAILSSLQMGFRTLAVERRSSEVWQLLGTVKTEFGRFGELLTKARDHLERASSTLGSATDRTRAIERRLREVELLPEPGGGRPPAE